MLYPWVGSIHRLRRRALVSGAVETLGRVLWWVAPLSLAYLLWSQFSAWGRYLAPAAGATALTLLLVAAMVGALRSRRTDVYLAKWIDLRSGLDDRLASAVEWSTLQAPDEFQRRCVEQLVLQLGARTWTLTLPPTAPSRWPITIALLLMVAGVPFAYVRRAGVVVERDARTKAVLASGLSKAAAQDAAAVESASHGANDQQVEQLSTELSAVLSEIDRGTSTRERSLERLERLRMQIEKSSGGERHANTGKSPTENGSIGALSQAIGRADAKGVVEAVDALATSMRGNRLTEGELAELLPILDNLGSIMKPVDPALATTLAEAARRVAAGDQGGAAERLARLTDPKLEAIAKLQRPLSSSAALQQALEAVDSVTRSIRTAGEGTSSPVVDRGGGGTGAGSNSGSKVADPSAPGPEPGRELVVHGTWNGKVMRQLFDSSSGVIAGDEAKRMLVEHDRVVEERFRRDEVPQEYEAAVRAYFAALHGKGK